MAQVTANTKMIKDFIEEIVIYTRLRSIVHTWFLISHVSKASKSNPDFSELKDIIVDTVKVLKYNIPPSIAKMVNSDPNNDYVYLFNVIRYEADALEADISLSLLAQQKGWIDYTHTNEIDITIYDLVHSNHTHTGFKIITKYNNDPLELLWYVYGEQATPTTTNTNGAN